MSGIFFEELLDLFRRAARAHRIALGMFVTFDIILRCIFFALYLQTGIAGIGERCRGACEVQAGLLVLRARLGVTDGATPVLVFLASFDSCHFIALLLKILHCRASANMCKC